MVSRRRAVVVVDDDSHIQRIGLASEETTGTQRVSHGLIKYQSRSWPQRGTKVDGSHHGDNPLIKPTGVQITTQSLPGPATREYWNVIGVTIYLGYELQCLLFGVLPVFQNLNY